MNFPRPMWVLIIGLLVTAVIGLVWAALGMAGAYLVSIVLTANWMFGFLLWVIVVDTKRRWPHLSLSDRVGMLLASGAEHHRHDEIATRERRTHG